MEFNFRLTRSEGGYTVVEVLVALAILSIALVPTVQFSSKVMNTNATRDLSTAAHLARTVMERAIAERDFSDSWTDVSVNQKSYHIEKKTVDRQGLVTLQIRIYKKNSQTPIVELRTLRLADD